MNILSFIADLVTIILFSVSILKYVYDYIVSKRFNDLFKKAADFLKQYYDYFKNT